MSSRRQLLAWVASLALVVTLAYGYQAYAERREERTKSYPQFLQDLRQGKVESVTATFGEQLLRVKLKGIEVPRVVLGPADPEVLRADLAAASPEDSPISPIWQTPSLLKAIGKLAAVVIPIGVIIVLVYLAFTRHVSSGNNQAMQFGRSRARRITDGMPRKTFDDVAGVSEAIEELFEIVDFLRDADKYKRLGAEIPKGVLLMGPPGCGKTLLARAVAGEAEVPFFHISGSDFVEMFVGVGASRVRDMFEQAKANRPCIVFIDELDAVGRHRGAGLGGGHDEREQTVNQLLVEMDGFEPNTGIIVMAATNRPDILDPALLRPGRFDRRVVVDHPDLRGRTDILRLYIKSKPVAEDVDIEVLARRTPGLTGADLYSIINEASILAAREDRSRVEMDDLEEGIERVIAGRERRSRVLLPSERRLVAYHEAGHAVVGHFHPRCVPVHKISILPRGRALGYVTSLPEEERYNQSVAELKAMMAQLLGGRVAEEIFFGRAEVTTGASNDLERVTEIARSMVCDFGMSEEIGPLTLGRRHGPIFLGRDLAEERNYSEESAQRIDLEVRRLIEEAHTQAEQIVTQHRDAMDDLVEVLLERETLDAADLATILGEPPVKIGAAADKLAATESDTDAAEQP